MLTNIIHDNMTSLITGKYKSNEYLTPKLTIKLIYVTKICHVQKNRRKFNLERYYVKRT